MTKDIVKHLEYVNWAHFSPQDQFQISSRIVQTRKSTIMTPAKVFCVLSVLVGLLATSHGQTFTNPIMTDIAPDPQILRWQGFYYMVLSLEARNMVIYKSKVLTDFNNVETNTIVRPNATFDACWAPELHEIQGEIYCYFSMHRSGENDHRMWVTKAVDPSNLMGEWTSPIQLMPDEAEDANDGTVWQHPTNKWMYFIFTRLIPGFQDPSLTIAPMLNPFTVLTPRVTLRNPARGMWDCVDACINEGAHVINGKNNISHLIFSGGMTGCPSYALGRMSIRPELDPLVPGNWEYVDEAVFATNPEENVYGPGHAAFVLSPDGTETWFAYHAQNSSRMFDPLRIAYLDKLLWDFNGYPVFPKPHGYGTPLPLPSGQEP